MKVSVIISPLLFCMLSGHLLFAQKVITGRVMDETDGSPIAYTNIGIVGHNMGTVSDENGSFRLLLPEDFTGNDAVVVFSSVGYLDLEVPASELMNQKTPQYRLKPHIHEIPEIRVSRKPPKEVFYGNRSRALATHFNFYHIKEDFDDGLGRELGKVLKIDPDIKLLGFSFYITGNPFKHVKFRMNLYDLSGTAPEKIPLEKDVLFDVNQRKGRVNVDLAPYDIYLKGYDKIGVTIQWLQSELDEANNTYFSIPAGLIAAKGALYRPKSEAVWEFPKVNLSMYLKALRSR